MSILLDSGAIPSQTSDGYLADSLFSLSYISANSFDSIAISSGLLVNADIRDSYPIINIINSDTLKFNGIINNDSISVNSGIITRAQVFSNNQIDNFSATQPIKKAARYELVIRI